MVIGAAACAWMLHPQSHNNVTVSIKAHAQQDMPVVCVSICLQVARLLLYKEYWYGTAESTSGLTRRSKQLAAAAAAGSADAGAPSSSSSSEDQTQIQTTPGYVLQLLPSHKFDVPVINLPRPQPQQLAGSWNVFLVAANPILEENPDTLQVRVQVLQH
jgi:hypothetical protein